MTAMAEPLIIREFSELTGLSKDEISDLKDFALQNQCDSEGDYRPVLEWRNGRLKAQNYVGVIQTRKGKVLEILPKVDLVADDDEKTKRVFLNMLRAWRGVNHARFSESGIRAMQRFNMLEIFVRLFLENLTHLTKRGLAKHYQLVEENLPCLKGRILFSPHLRENTANRARFYVQYDDFNANRPANRLIHSAIDKLKPMVRHPDNRKLLRQMKICFNDIPVSRNHDDDWGKHKIDRAMRHYHAVMQWVGLFLFGQGLTTFSGKHINRCLLFPMEQIFEDFVAKNFRAHQNYFSVQTQASGKHLATTADNKPVFRIRPDIRLQRGPMQFILDTKWKRINEGGASLTRGVSQADMYQLYAYGKKYDCKTVALIYPQTKHFTRPFYYDFDHALRLVCLPFDVTEPKRSVERIIDRLCAGGVM